MKIQMIALLVLAAAASAFAQETNVVDKRRGEGFGGPGRNGHERPDWGPGQREERQQRNVQLIGKVLSDIGVSDEDKIKIHDLQEEHRAKMKANMDRTFVAREKLSRLQDSGATDAELDAAINEVSEAQSEQLRILVRNRMEMEQILGKEKYARFMESARMQFRQHEGRRGDDGLPPRPGLPPLSGRGPDQPPPPQPRE
ncbi:MAG: hypothetical protein K9M54_07415 [Kiritimatiellales bacterium]|nr:hypothetical protein [Kiritimatiellales bacterium]MCF7863710.1 hypothetical protein [Kiritimatiellales bacterium]